MKKSQFTLLELLIVVAVIAFLVSLLLPSLKKARKAANTAVCMSNLSQLGKAMTGYLVDNNNFYPYTRLKDNIDDIISWDDLISGYDGRERMTLSQMKEFVGDFNQENPLYICQEDTTPRRWEWVPRRSYGISIYRSRLTNLNGGISGGMTDGTDMSRQLPTINYPSETILLSELFNLDNRMGAHWGSINARHHFNIWTNNSPNPLPHTKKFNYLFTDGHVEAMTYPETLLGRSASPDDATGTMWDASPER